MFERQVRFPDITVTQVRKKGIWVTPARLFQVVVFGSFLLILAAHRAEALDGELGRYVFNDHEAGRLITVWYAKPANFSAATPIVMVLHGKKRNAQSYRDVWKKYADEYGLMILAPEFSEQLFPGRQYSRGNYFALTPAEARKNKTRPQINDPRVWSFRIPDKIFADFGINRERTSQKKYYLYGHSAGAQFAHRMLELLPDSRVEMAVIANSGWYTLPDLRESWPYGLEGSMVKPENVKEFLALPLLILLGEKDTDPQHPGLRRNAKADRQGTNRLLRGQYFFRYAAKLAGDLKTPFGWRLHIVPEATHSNKAMASAAAAFIARDIMEKR